MASPPVNAHGYMSDYLGWSAALTDVLETVPDVAYPESTRTFARMRNDPQITAILTAYFLPIMATPKYVDPAGCRPEVVQQIADDLGLPILGKDNKPGPARRRGVDIVDHVRVALLHLVYGHMPFAQQYEMRDGKARLIKLSERMPSTITDILTDDEGDLESILQFGEKQTIPAEHLVWYVRDREGSAWQGRSMLRPAYGAWLIKQEMWRVLATSNRRFGMGVPNVEAPAGATGEQIEQAALLASAIRVGDQAGVGLPPGFKLSLAGITGSTPDTLAFIRYLDGQMAQMVLASVLNLDASPNGSRALGDTFVNLLHTSLNAIAGNMAKTLTNLAVQMVDYNWGEEENVPRIVFEDVASQPAVTAESIMGLMQCGAITADPALEAWVRERWTLPEKEEVEEPPPPVLPPVPVADPESDPAALPATPAVQAARFRVRAATAASTRRELTEIEASSGMDPDRLDEKWTDTVADLLKSWATVGKAQRLEILEQIKAAVDDDNVDALANLAVSSDDAAILLANAMADMAEESASEVKKEAKKQGVTIPAVEQDTDRLTLVGAAVAALIATGLASAAGREALRVWTPGRSGEDVAGQVGTHLDNLSSSYLTDQLGNAVSVAQNAGRNAAMQAAPKAKYFASEVLDSNTCGKCKKIDGQELGGMEEAAQTYASGGYIDCEGRLRCRGIVVAVWE